MGGEDDQIVSIDNLDLWSGKSLQIPGQDGYNYVMLAQSRWDRKLYARPFKNKQAAGDAVDALAQILRDMQPQKPKEVVVDLGPEMNSRRFKDYLASKGMALVSAGAGIAYVTVAGEAIQGDPARPGEDNVDPSDPTVAPAPAAHVVLTTLEAIECVRY